MQRSRFDRAAAIEHLELAQWLVDSGYGLIQRQRRIVFNLERDGLSAETARMQLSEFERSQLGRIAHRDRIASTLGAALA